MGDQHAHEVRILAEQPQVVEELNEVGAHTAQPAAQAQVAAAVQQPFVQQIPITELPSSTT